VNKEKVSENIANLSIYTSSLLGTVKGYKPQHLVIHDLIGRLNFGCINGVNKYSMCSYSFIEKRTTIAPKTARKVIDFLIENGYIKQKITSKKDFGGYEYQFIKPYEMFLHFHGKQVDVPHKPNKKSYG
jgi:hypothetical protein